MPVYEYVCTECDTYFTAMRSMDQYNEPCACPDCAGEARKIISAPQLNTMRADRKYAFETNERSRHEPRVSHAGHGHTCGAGCNHHHHHSKPKNEEAKPAYKQQVNRRPWMLGH